MNEKEAKNVLRYDFAILLTPIMLVSFVWLEEIAKGSELYYWGGLILNHYFVEIMFAAFIPLAIGTFLLLFSRIEEAPKILKYILYSITTLSLISTLFVAHSLATVPRSGKQYLFHVSPDTFAGNITRAHDGEYRGEAYQTLFTQNYHTSLVVFGGSYPEPYVRLQTTRTINLNGTLRVYVFLYRLTEDYRQGLPLYYSFIEKSIDFEGSSFWREEMVMPEIRWGSSSEHERIRLGGYKIGLLLFLELVGSDYGEVIHFTGDIAGSFHIIDFRVDSPLQNGMAILLCGIFIGIYVQILARPVISRAKER